MGSFSDVGLALHSSASPSASPLPSPSPSGSPSTQRRNSSSSHPPTKWSLWQKTEPSTSSSPCGSPKARRRSLGGRQRRTSSEGALSGREPAQPLVSDAVAPHYAEAKGNECAHQVLCEAGAIEQPPAARQKRVSREHLARNMKRASGETLVGGVGGAAEEPPGARRPARARRLSAPDCFKAGRRMSTPDIVLRSFEVAAQATSPPRAAAAHGPPHRMQSRRNSLPGRPGGCLLSRTNSFPAADAHSEQGSFRSRGSPLGAQSREEGSFSSKVSGSRATVEQLHDLAARADYEPPPENSLTFERVRWGTARSPPLDPLQAPL